MKYFALTFALLLTPFVVFGAAADNSFYSLVPLPNIDYSNSSLTEYINQMFQLIITVAVLLAVIRIVTGGFKYMTSEAVGAKGDARETIQNAVFGLILLLGSWLILYTINPQILDLSALKFDSLGDGGKAAQDVAEYETNRQARLETLLGVTTTSNIRDARKRSLECSSYGGEGKINTITEQICTRDCRERTKYQVVCSKKEPGG